MPTDKHTKQVEGYFDTIAQDYHRRYTDHDSYLSYFFTERLLLAVDGLDLDEKDILDVGAGTGNLYDHVVLRATPASYHATDISAAMLSESNIPEESRYVGTLDTIVGLSSDYDYIFCLGVTTYMDSAAIDRLIHYAHEHLRPDGLLIISFTNSQGADHTIRSLLRPVAHLLGKRDKLLGQHFAIYATSVSKVVKKYKEYFTPIEINELNLSITGWSRLFPKSSARLAQKYQKNIKNKAIRKFLSSDFLLRLEKK